MLAAPLYAGTVSVRVDQEEAGSLEAMLAEWDADGDVSHDEGSLGTSCRCSDPSSETVPVGIRVILEAGAPRRSDRA